VGVGLWAIDGLSWLSWWGMSVLVNAVPGAFAETRNPAPLCTGRSSLVSLPGTLCHSLLGGVGAAARE
jgi:hypothetical protein